MTESDRTWIDVVYDLLADIAARRDRALVSDAAHSLFVGLPVMVSGKPSFMIARSGYWEVAVYSGDTSQPYVSAYLAREPSIPNRCPVSARLAVLGVLAHGAANTARAIGQNDLADNILRALDTVYSVVLPFAEGRTESLTFSAIFEGDGQTWIVYAPPTALQLSEDGSIVGLRYGRRILGRRGVVELEVRV